jgi:hypothetical protein
VAEERLVGRREIGALSSQRGFGKLPKMDALS